MFDHLNVCITKNWHVVDNISHIVEVITSVIDDSIIVANVHKPQIRNNSCFYHCHHA